MITFKNFQNMHGANVPGRARKIQSDVIMLNTWWQDIQAQTAYLYDIFHDIGEEHFKLNDLHPQDDPNKTAIPIKFIRHAGQTYNKDPITFWLQLQPGQECNVDYYDSMFGKKYQATWPVGLFIDICDEGGKYNKWLVVNTANYNQNQFPTWELLRCDYVFQWIHNGKRYECPGVLQSQNSYNSGLWTDYKVTSVEDQQKMALPLSSITETLSYNHRLIVDSNLYNDDAENRAWLVSKMKRVSPNGIVVVTMAQDIYDQHNDYIEKDAEGNIIGKWANYFNSNIEPTSIPEDIPSSITSRITVSGKPQFKIGGSAKTFTVTYYDNENQEMTGHQPGSWALSIDGTSVPNNLVELTSSDDGVKLKVKFLGDDTYIGKILTVTNTSDDATAEIQMEIIAL